MRLLQGIVEKRSDDDLMRQSQMRCGKWLGRAEDGLVMSSKQNEVKWAAASRVCCVAGRLVQGVSRITEFAEIDQVRSRMMGRSENLSEVLVEESNRRGK
jgi:hypothetical protein